MPAVTWDQPSDGLVSDLNPSLTLKNDQGRALTAESAGVAVHATSQDAEAVVARTDHTLTGRFTSDKLIALAAIAPKLIAGIAVNQVGNIAALAGSNNADPALPVIQSQKGIGVMGITDRFDAIGAAGFAVGPRSLGVLGQADSGVGVRGISTGAGVEGSASAGPGVAGFTQHKEASGVYGFGPGPIGAGVMGEGQLGPGVAAHSVAGPGVSALSEQAMGVIGEAKAANAAGVFGRNDHSSGVGVDAFSENGTGVRAISSKGIAVVADASADRAIDASTFNSSEPAIYSYSPLTSALKARTLGGVGVDSIGKTGVAGATLFGPDPSDYKVGAGVFGQGLGGNGVCGITLTGAGVVGVGHPILGAWAGAFTGDVVVDGDLIVNGFIWKVISLFSIDHPLDPERKVLNHAAVEAPEYKTFYDGVAKLDARGCGRVRLPRWFEALNGDLRYQLTPIGSAAPDLHVAQEVKNGVFLIAGGAPRQRVCWQVTGVRKDAWAKSHPIEVEQSKRAAQRTSRPRVGLPTPAFLEKQAAALKEEAAAVKKDGAQRERIAKARRPPEPLKAVPVPAPPAADKTPREIASRVLDTAQRLTTNG